MFPDVQGRRTRKVHLLGAYLTRVLHAVAAHDANLANAFIRVAGLVSPPQSLLRPRIALRVIVAGRTHASPPTGVPDTATAATSAPKAKFNLRNDRHHTRRAIRPPEEFWASPRVPSARRCFVAQMMTGVAWPVVEAARG